MATYSFAELVLNDHLTNSLNFNPSTTGMTNGSLTSMSSGKMAGHKRKRSSIPDILSSTAGQAKKLLKKFSTSFVTSSDDASFSSDKIVPNNGVAPLRECGKNKVRFTLSKEKLSTKEKVGLEKIETCDALASGTFLVSRSPKAVCFDSVSSTKWSRLEITMSPKKFEQTSSEGPQQSGNVHECLSHHDVVSSSHVHASRMLLWDQVSMDDAVTKEFPRFSDPFGSDQTVVKERMLYLNGSRRVTSSEHDLCMPLKNVGVNKHPPKLSPKTENVDNKHVLQHHLQNGSCLAIKNYEATSVKYKNLFTNGTNPLIKDVYRQNKVLKALFDDTGFFSENMDAISEPLLRPTGRATKTAWEKDREDKGKSDDSKVTKSSILNKSPTLVRTKSTNSILFLPFPKVPFKIKAIQPTQTRFEVSYTASSMFPTVKTAGEVFEAKLQEVTIDGAGREGFRNSPSGFSCSITVESSDPASKFEEIKHALRVVCDAYNMHAMQETVAKISSKRLKEGHNEEAAVLKYPSYNTAVVGSTCRADSNELLMEQYNLQASSVDGDSVAPGTADMGSIVDSDNHVSLSEETMPIKKETGTTAVSVESSNSQEAVRPVRRSHRKIKTVGLWKERNAYATRVTRPTSTHPIQGKSNLVNCPFNFIGDREYLDKTMIVNQFVQDITGVPVVVLERLNMQEVEEKLRNRASSST